MDLTVHIKITEYFDTKSMELTCQLEIEFCLKIVNEKLDEIAKDKKENENLGKSFFEQISTYICIKQIFIILKIYSTALDSDEEPATKKAKKQGKYPELNRRSCRKSKKV